jgi:YD repeat-containing protein
MTEKFKRLISLVLVASFCFLISCSRRHRVAVELQFDAAGHLLSSTGPDGKKTTFKYDSRGLVIDATSPDGSAQFDYNAHRNRIWVRDDAGATEYYYDAFDRLSAAIWDRGPRRLLSYEYDHTGLPSRITVVNLQPLGSDPRFSAQVAKLGVPVPSDASAWHEREQLVLDLAEQVRAAADSGNAPWLANEISYIRNLQGDLEEIRS